MPSADPIGSDAAEQLCRRCATNPAELKIRQDLLCTDCFVKYVKTKTIKRMEAFRVRSLAAGETRKLLLPISFGISSTCLLHVLNEHLAGQVSKSGRPGYALHIVHVNFDQDAVTQNRKLDALRERYPEHEYSLISLFEDHATGNGESGVENLDETSAAMDLAALLSAVASPSSKQDICTVSLRRRLVEHATHHDCEGILWGDTTTSLAEKVLAETAKGRGHSLAWLTNDGESPLGVPFYFPMKDLLRKELPAFAEASGLVPDLVETSSEIASATVNTKHATIDGLMKEYFESVEENYPSIVANVVRTSSKLQPPQASTTSPNHCRMCAMPKEEENNSIGQDDATAHERGFTVPPTHALCYGCRQSLYQNS